MWIVNQDGFFSIVEKGGRKDKPLSVRARLRKDLVMFLKRLEDVPDLSRIVMTDDYGYDYQCRVFISREELIDYQTKVAMSLDYDNFKSSLPYTEGHRLHIYHNLWGELYQLAHQHPTGRQHQGAITGRFDRFPSSVEEIDFEKGLEELEATDEGFLNNDEGLRKWREIKSFSKDVAGQLNSSPFSIAKEGLEKVPEVFDMDFAEVERQAAGIDPGMSSICVFGEEPEIYEPDSSTTLCPAVNQVDLIGGRGRKRRKKARKMAARASRKRAAM